MRLLITNQNVSLNTWYRICSPERHLKQNLITRILYKWCVMCVCVCVQSCLTLCDPMDCNSPGFSVHWLLQARILEWVAMPSPGDLSNPGIEPASLMSPALAGGFFTTSTTTFTTKPKPIHLQSINLWKGDKNIQWVSSASGVGKVGQLRVNQWS